ncbi:MAG: response regulator [Pedobacter sp.]
MEEQVKILCVDDEKNVLRALQRLFLDDDYEIYTALSAKEGLEILNAVDAVQVVISDYRMPGMNGIEFLREVYKNWPDTVRLVLSGFADTAAVVGAINDGQIYKFIPKPWNDDDLRFTIQKGIERYFLKIKNSQLMDELKASNEKLRKINENLEAAAQYFIKDTFQNQAKNIYNHIISSLPFGIVGIDSEGCIIFCNNTALDFLGETKREIWGWSSACKFPEVLCPFLQKFMNQGVLSENCKIGERNGWIRGSKICLGNQEFVVLAFDLEDQDHV